MPDTTDTDSPAAQQKTAQPNQAWVAGMQRTTRQHVDYYPTPPWATRALCERIDLAGCVVWEPAAGGRHMADVLAETVGDDGQVVATDLYDHGAGMGGVDYLSDATRGYCQPDWVITNPPYVLAADFTLTALRDAQVGVAMLMRIAFLEGGKRWHRLYQSHPPSRLLVFSERVPMTAGRLDPNVASLPCYGWFIWEHTADPADGSRLGWFGPGTRDRLEQPGDYGEPPQTVLAFGDLAVPDSERLELG